ncbi:hypothetical protein [Archangium sp.]|uniref:hypothetical protein n=1 Tax=Archangium sp. TaxID=1872627 RepID=UPI002D555BCB|nr:hypothetical protein [Archangium sp.]HYO53708.1 hypothetical protein [Archangium sp.]
MLNLGITRVMRETYAGSLEMMGELLQDLGLTWSESKSTLDRFHQHDEALLQASYQHHRDEERLVELAKKARQELEELFEKDEQKKPA